MADLRDDPVFFVLGFRCSVIAGGIAAAFQNDLPAWVRIASAIAALIAAWGLPRTLRTMWTIARESPDAVENPFRRRGGAHKARDD